MPADVVRMYINYIKDGKQNPILDSLRAQVNKDKRELKIPHLERRKNVKIYQSN